MAKDMSFNQRAERQSRLLQKGAKAALEKEPPVGNPKGCLRRRRTYL
jgi:hypothetical protein